MQLPRPYWAWPRCTSFPALRWPNSSKALYRAVGTLLGAGGRPPGATAGTVAVAAEHCHRPVDGTCCSFR
uniref:Uncharacterized protein n=1 Tax=Ditylenchus dipsaci TaxID=166011 RepID=A0A915DTZ0_9BILA